jgi:Ca2+-binding EF-hand superfamily protein
MRAARAVGFGLALMVASADSAPAQNAGGINYVELFQQLDANGDMVIDRGEVPESGRVAFETLLKHADTNKDGKIEREEYRDLLTSLRDSFGTIASRFGELDRNGDGKVTKDEFKGPEPLFARIDADGDGSISKEEAAKFQPAQGAGAGGGMLAQRILGMDKNNDGKVSRDEFTGIPANFDRWDANKDGFITRDEIPGGAAAAQPKAKGAEEKATEKPAEKPTSPAPATAPAPDRAAMRERLQAMDKDGDGKVSKDEFTGPAQLFERLDANSDGVISREDNPNAPAAGATGGERFRAMDKNNDGKVSKDEFAGPAQLFERLDANSDGFVTMQEVARMYREGANPPAGRGAMGDRLRAMDKNNDGKVSKDEFAGPAQLFERLDANSDGFISSDEFPQNRPGAGKAQGKRQRPDANKV